MVLYGDDFAFMNAYLSYKSLEKMILRDARGSSKSLWRLGAFDKLVFAERLVSFLNRRILRKKHFEFRLR
jgi:hypothetical protein